jgi:nucleoside-diphosphate-sugar epimerase
VAVAANAKTLTGKRILVTGVTGWVAGPLARSLAGWGNEVFGAARLADPAARRELEDAGITPVPIDLSRSDLDSVPEGLDVVVNMAVAKVDDFGLALRVNAEGAADLLEVAAGRAGGGLQFLHCSSTAVYEPRDHEPRREGDPLGDSHRPMPGMPTYSISKIASEVLVGHTAKRLGVDTVIARLNVPYGDTYGWPLFHLAMMERSMAVPVHTNAPTSYTPIHADDIASSVPYLLELASVPATIVNWGGDQVVSIEDWCTHLGELTGLTPVFEPTDATIAAIIPDLGRLHATGFRSNVDWRDGMERLLVTSRPDLVGDGGGTGG